MDYNELYKKYKKLLKENKKLKKDISLYQQKYGSISDKEAKIYQDDKMIFKKTNEDNSNIINKVSPPDKKIDLFMSLFQGRKDVYAHRWKNKNGNTGYSPVCVNEWVQGICKKPKVKCLNCKNRKFATLTESVIRNNLLGKEIIGIYPLLKDATCKFLAIDFDKGNWQDDVSTIRQIANKKNIPLYIERSRSGDGAHVWFFFEEKIPASIARKFGTALITCAMEMRHEIKFESYDRLFPNQDKRPKGGLGNLIALPLQKLSRKDGNSLFVDGNYTAYEDQWKFLYNIEKIKNDKVEKYILELTTGNELGEYGTENDEKPWDNISNQTIITCSEYPNKVSIVKADMLYIKKDGLSQKLMNKIKRLAAFLNLSFLKLRLCVYQHIINQELFHSRKRQINIFVCPVVVKKNLIPYSKKVTLNFFLLIKEIRELI